MSSNQSDKAKKNDTKENQESLHHLPQVVRKEMIDYENTLSEIAPPIHYESHKVIKPELYTVKGIRKAKTLPVIKYYDPTLFLEKSFKNDQPEPPSFLPLDFCDILPMDCPDLPAPARSKYVQISGEVEWRECTVVSYDKEARKFEIEWKNEDMPNKYVSRWNIKFSGETIESCEERKVHAQQFQKVAEAILRYTVTNHIVAKNIPNPERLLAPYPEEILRDILFLSNLNEKLIKDKYNLVLNLCNEVQSLYYGELVRLYSESIVGVYSPPIFKHYIRTPHRIRYDNNIPESSLSLNERIIGFSHHMIRYYPPIYDFYINMTLEICKLKAVDMLFTSKPVPYPVTSYDNIRSVKLMHKEKSIEELYPKRPEKIPLPLHMFSMLERQQLEEAISLYIKSLRFMEEVIIDRYYYLIESANKWKTGTETNKDSFDDILITPYEGGELIPLVTLIGDNVEQGSKRIITEVTRTVNVLYFTTINDKIMESLRGLDELFSSYHYPPSGFDIYSNIVNMDIDLYKSYYGIDYKQLVPYTTYIETEINRQRHADFSSFKPYYQVKLVYNNGICFEFEPPLPSFINEMNALFHFILQSVGEVDFIDLDFISDKLSPSSLPFDLNHIDVGKHYNNIIQSISHSILLSLAFLVFMEKYIPFLPVNDEAYVRSFRSVIPYGNWIIKDQCKEIAKSIALIDEIHMTFPDQVTFGIFEIDIKNIKNMLVTKTEKRISLFKAFMANDIHLYYSGLKFDLDPYIKLLLSRPKTTSELQELVKSLEREEGLAEITQVNINRIKNLLSILENFNSFIPEKYLNEFISILKCPTKLSDALETAKLIIPECNSTFTVFLRHQQVVIRKRIEELQLVIEKLNKYGIEGIEHASDIYEEIMSCQRDLVEIDDKLRTFNMDEKLLGFDITPFPEIQQYRSEVAPLLAVWQDVIQWEEKYPEWMDGNIQKLPTNLTNQINILYTSACALETLFLLRHLDGPEAVAKLIQQQCLTFRDFLPLVKMLSSKAMKFRHLNRIIQQLGMKINLHEELTLRKLLKSGAIDHISEIEEILDQAYREFDFEAKVDEIMGLWKDKTSYDSTGKAFCIHAPLRLEYDVFTKTHMCVNTQKQYNALDEQLITTTNLVLNPESSSMYEALTKYIRLLKDSENLLNNWMKFQKMYIKFHTLFTSDITNPQFKSLLIRYQNIDNFYDTIISTAIASPHLLILMSESGFPRNIRLALEAADGLKKELKKLVNNIRDEFPRLYFINDDNLLAYIKSSTTPEKCNDFISSIFPNIAKLDINYGENTIIGIIDSAQMVIPLTTPISYINSEGKELSLSEWGKELEKEIEHTLKHELDLLMTPPPNEGDNISMITAGSLSTNRLSSFSKLNSRPTTQMTNLLSPSSRCTTANTQSSTPLSTLKSPIKTSKNNPIMKFDFKNINNLKGSSINLLSPTQRHLTNLPSSRRSSRVFLQSSESTKPFKHEFTWLDRIKEDFSSQILLLYRHLLFTSEIEEVLKEKKPLQPILDQINKNLEQLMKDIQFAYNTPTIWKYNSVYLLELYFRDSVQNMIENNVNNPNAFDWISKFRAYTPKYNKFEILKAKRFGYPLVNANANNANANINNEEVEIPTIVYISIMNEHIEYGFQYIGITSQLIFTPTIEKCFQFLCFTLNHKKGAILEGDPVSGKTDTILALSSFLGKECFILPCNDGLNRKILVNFMTGIYKCNCWGLFDRLEDININILKNIYYAITQMISQINNIITANIIEQNMFQLPFPIFCTYSPDTNGRNMITNDLKKYFRICTYLKVDYHSIITIYLDLLQFDNPKKTSKQLDQLVNEFNSKFSDFKSKITLRVICKIFDYIRGLLKDANYYESCSDIELLHTSFSHCIIPNFNNNETCQFWEIFNKIFQQPDLVLEDQQQLIEIYKDIYEKNNYDNTNDEQILKSIDFTWTLKNSHSIAVVGPSGYGKSVLISMCQKEMEDQHMSEINIIKYYPQAESTIKFYGNDYVSGVIHKLIRKCVTEREEQYHWIILDGPITQEAIHYTIEKRMMSINLENNSKLLTNKNICFIYETDSLQDVSPTVLNRLSLIAVDGVKIQWKSLLFTFIRQLDKVFQPYKDYITDILSILFTHVEKYYNKHPMMLTKHILKDLNSLYISTFNLILSFFHSFQLSTVAKMREKIQQEIPETMKNSRSHRFTSVIETLMYPNDERGRCSYSLLKLLRPVQSLDKIFKDDSLKKYLQGFLFIGVLWGMGGCLNYEDKNKFSRYLLDNIFLTDQYKDIFIFLPSHIDEDDSNLFDYMLETGLSGKINYHMWKDNIQGKKYINFNNTEIYLNTVQYQYSKYFINYCTNSYSPLMLLGHKATMKTRAVYLSLNVTNECYFDNIEWATRIPFNVATKPNIINKTIVNYMKLCDSEKYKPQFTNKCIIFIDDISANQHEDKEKNGSNFENLRQLHQMKVINLDNYSTEILMPLKGVSLLYSVNIDNPHTEKIDERFKHSIIKIYLDSPSEKDVTEYFSAVINKHFVNQFSTTVLESTKPLTNLTLEVIKKFAELTDTTEYTYLLNYNAIAINEILKCLTTRITTRTIKTPYDLQRLWYHEMSRTFIDPLFNPELANQFKLILEQAIYDTYPQTTPEDLFLVRNDNTANPQNSDEYYCSLPDEIIFTNILHDAEKVPVYNEMTPTIWKQLQLEIKVAIDTYNRNQTDTINLTIFKEGIDHILHIGRIISFNNSNVLMIGIPGSGKKSLIKLVSSLIGYELDLVTIDTQSVTAYEIWKRKITKILLSCGNEILTENENKTTSLPPKQYILCCSETIFDNLDILSDINSLLEDYTNLNHLFYQPVIQDVIRKLKPLMNEKTKKKREFIQIPPLKLTTSRISDAKIFDYFVNCAKSKIHFVITTPFNDKVRKIYDLFPSLFKFFHPIIITPWEYEPKIQVANYLFDNCKTNIVPLPPLLFFESRIQMNEMLSKTAVVLAKFHEIICKDLIINGNRKYSTSRPNTSVTHYPQQISFITSLTPSLSTNDDYFYTGNSSATISRPATAATHGLNEEEIIKLSSRFDYVLNNEYHTSPLSFCLFVKHFLELFLNKRVELTKYYKKLIKGVDQMQALRELVHSMEKRMKKLLPILKQKEKEVMDFMESLTKQMAESEEAQKAFLEQEAAVKAEEDRANKLKAEIEAELALIRPQLEEAMKQIRSIKKSEIEEIKTMPNPPEMIKLTLEAVCLLLEIKPRRLRDPDHPGDFMVDYWFSSMTACGKPDEFLNKVLTFDKDKAPKKAINEIKKDRFLKNPNFTPERVKLASTACEGLCKWVRVVLIYDEVQKKIKPKLEELAKLEEYIRQLKEKIDEHRKRYEELLEKSKNMKQQLEDLEKELQTLKDEYNHRKAEIERAKDLIRSTDDEMQKWLINIRKLAILRTQVLGDAILESALITFFSNLTIKERTKVGTKLLDLLKENDIPISECKNGVISIGESSISEKDSLLWESNQLPNVPIYRQNTLMYYIMKKVKIPTIIIYDKEGLAFKYIEKMENDNNDKNQKAKNEKNKKLNNRRKKDINNPVVTLSQIDMNIYHKGQILPCGIELSNLLYQTSQQSVPIIINELDNRFNPVVMNLILDRYNIDSLSSLNNYMKYLANVIKDDIFEADDIISSNNNNDDDNTSTSKRDDETETVFTDEVEESIITKTISAQNEENENENEEVDGNNNAIKKKKKQPKNIIKIITYDESGEFPLFIFTKKPIDLSDEIRIRTSTILFEITDEIIDDSMKSSFLVTLRPADSQLNHELSLQKYNIYLKQQNNDDVILNILSNISGDLIHSAAYDIIKSSAQQSTEFENELKEIQQRKIQVKESLELYSPIATRGKLFYNVINSMNQISSSHSLTLIQIIQIIIESIKHMINLDQEINELVDSVTLAIIKEVSHLYNDNELHIFLLLLSLQYLKEQDRLSNNDLHYIYRVLSMDWDNPIESNIQLLFDMSGEDYYQQVTSLLQIVNDTKDKEWSEYLNGDYNKIPAKYRKMTFLQKLCILLSYGKSDSIYRIIPEFLKDILSSTSESNLNLSLQPLSLYQYITDTDCTVPIIILLPDHNGECSELQTYTFFKQYKIKVFSYINDYDEVISLEGFNDYFKYGGVILITDVTTDSNNIVSIIEYMKTNKINENFRLLFEFYNDDELPPYIYSRSSIYLYHQTTSVMGNLKVIYANMYEKYYIYFPGYSLLCQRWKALIFLLITLYNSLCYRNFLLHSPILYGYSDLMGSIEVGFQLFQSYDSAISLKWLRYYCELIFGSDITKEEEVVTLQSMIDLYLKENNIVTNPRGIPDFKYCLFYDLPQKKTIIPTALPKEYASFLSNIIEPLPFENFLVTSEDFEKHYVSETKILKENLKEILKILTNQ